MAKDKKRKKGSVAVLHKDDMPPGSKLVSEMEYFGSSAIYGRSGTGKTTLSATWPKPILYINILDDGTDSIADEEGVIVKNVSSSEEMTEVIHWAMARAKKKKLKFKTIVFETVFKQSRKFAGNKRRRGRSKISTTKSKRDGK